MNKKIHVSKDNSMYDFKTQWKVEEETSFTHISSVYNYKLFKDVHYTVTMVSLPAQQLNLLIQSDLGQDN